MNLPEEIEKAVKEFAADWMGMNGEVVDIYRCGLLKGAGLALDKAKEIYHPLIAPAGEPEKPQ
jgi:hypothetical protein